MEVRRISVNIRGLGKGIIKISGLMCLCAGLWVMSPMDSQAAVKQAEIRTRSSYVVKIEAPSVDVHRSASEGSARQGQVMRGQTEKALEEVGDKIAPGDKAEVEADLNSLKEAINRAPVEEMTDAQVEDIKAGREKLMNSAQKLFAKVYEQAQASGAAGQAGPDMGGAGNAAGGDDVVDADFKEV